MPCFATIIKSGLNLPLNMVNAPILVLLYHRVAVRKDDPEQLAVSPENFAAQLRFLQENYHILRFEDDWRKSRRPAVVITFDDGYADNLHSALPVLSRSNIPATFFVSAGTIGDSRGFWWDRLGLLLLNRDIAYPEKWGSIDTSSRDARERLYQELQLKLKKAALGQREQILADLYSWSGLAGVVAAEDLPLSVEELRELLLSPLATIGSHTVNHRQLSALSTEEQRREIIDGHRQLETMVGKKLDTFSYPFGNHDDYNAESVAICRELGLKKVAANYPATAHSWSDSMQIPRLIVRNQPVAELRKQLALARWLR